MITKALSILLIGAALTPGSVASAVPKKAQLIITSRLAGGKILINDAETGRVTPNSICLDAGTYRVTVLFKDYDAYRFDFAIKAGRVVKIDVVTNGKSQVTYPSKHSSCRG